MSVGLAWKSAAKNDEKLVNQKLCSYLGCPSVTTYFKVVTRLKMLSFSKGGAINDKIIVCQIENQVERPDNNSVFFLKIAPRHF